MKPEWWTNGKACSRILRVIEIWREQGCEVTPLYSGAALLDAHQRGRREGLGKAAGLADDRAVGYGNATLVADAKSGACYKIAEAIRAEDQEVET